MKNKEINHGEAPLCACGCGNKVTWNKWDRKWNMFLKGHRTSKQKYIPDKEGPLCECGCGGHVKWSTQQNRWNRFIMYHGNSKNKIKWNRNNKKLCKCGCGQEVTYKHNYVKGHQSRSDRYWKLQEDIDNPKYCECGCGNIVTPGSRFLAGHNKGNLSKNPKKSQLCLCGCGEFTKPGNKYIHGHYWRNKTHTDETKKKMSKIQKNPSKEKRKRLSMAAKERELSKSIKLGKTKSKYCDAWQDGEYINDLRKSYCEECGVTNMLSLKVFSMQLHTHHKNGNENCAPNDIKTLCVKCHLRLHYYLRKKDNKGRLISHQK